MLFKVIGVLLFIGIITAAWLVRWLLPGILSAAELPMLAATVGGVLLFILLPLVEVLWGRELFLAGRARIEERTGIIRSRVLWQKLITIQTKSNNLLDPIFRTGPGRILLGLWQDAGFGSQPLSLTVVLTGIVLFGSTVSYLAANSSLLSGFSTLLLVGGFITGLYSRAKNHRNLFRDQFPGVLDRLADSLQAGFSLSQAIEFFAPNLSEPSASEMSRLFTQLNIGFSMEQAFAALYQRRPNEDVRLLVEGIMLQRQVGGNMVEMIRQIATLVRERVELENEIRTMTAQGRLSAVVIALLVPVSLGLLSLFPGYTDVLFRSTVGNLVLIAAGLLEVIGAFIVMRLIRIEV